jgi:tetratricopeptide (TPR) repeat protein
MSVNWEILKEKANQEFKKKNYNAAISLYSDAISKTTSIILEIDPHQDSLYSNRGLCYLQTKQNKQAINDLNKAISLNPRNIKALIRLAHIKTTMSELAEAEIYLKRCVEFEPDEEPHKDGVRKIRELITTQDELKKAKFILDYKKCEQLAEKLINSLVDTTSNKLIYVESLLNNCKVSDAINFLRHKLNDQEKKMDEFEYLLSLAYYYDGKYEKARHHLYSLISKDKDVEKYNKLWENLKYVENEKEKANDNYKKGDYDGAIFLYTKLLELDSGNKVFNSTIYANRALCYQKKNNYIQALQDINKSIELNPNYIKAYYRRATIHINLKNGDKAKEDVQQVLRMDPSKYIFNISF